MILSANLPFTDDQILDYVVDFLQMAHEANERYTVRDGINIARYALKRLSAHNFDAAGYTKSNRRVSALKEAASMILEGDAAGYFSDIMERYG